MCRPVASRLPKSKAAFKLEDFLSLTHHLESKPEYTVLICKRESIAFWSGQLCACWRMPTEKCFPPGCFSQPKDAGHQPVNSLLHWQENCALLYLNLEQNIFSLNSSQARDRSSLSKKLLWAGAYHKHTIVLSLGFSCIPPLFPVVTSIYLFLHSQLEPLFSPFLQSQLSSIPPLSSIHNYHICILLTPSTATTSASPFLFPQLPSWNFLSTYSCHLCDPPSFFNSYDLCILPSSFHSYHFSILLPLCKMPLSPCTVMNSLSSPFLSYHLYSR